MRKIKRIVTVFFLIILLLSNLSVRYAISIDNYVFEENGSLRLNFLDCYRIYYNSFNIKDVHGNDNWKTKRNFENALKKYLESIKEESEFDSKTAENIEYRWTNDKDILKEEDIFPNWMAGKLTARYCYMKWEVLGKVYICKAQANYVSVRWENTIGVNVYKEELTVKNSGEDSNGNKTTTFENEGTGETVTITENPDGTQTIESTDQDGNTTQTTKNQNGTVIATITYKSVLGEPRTANVFTNDVLEDIDQYKPDDIDGASARKIESATSKILTVISNIGIAVSVIMLAILGIKYMLGSIEEKAEYKAGMIPYLIGALLLFGVTTFVKILMAIGEKINTI